MNSSTRPTEPPNYLPISGLIGKSESLRELAESVGLEYIDLSDIRIDPQLVGRFPAQALFRENVLPLAEIAPKRVRVALSNPFNLEVVEELAALTGNRIDVVLAEPRAIEAKLNQLLGVGGGTVRGLIENGTRTTSISAEVKEDLDDQGGDASVVRLVNELLLEALAQSASDVHLEPSGDALEVRFRVDGILRVQPMPQELHRFRSAIVSRLKIMAKLNIAEKRLPQDGRIQVTLQGRDIDVRVSVIPMLYGEGVVMRLLDRSKTAIDLKQLHVPPKLLDSWRQIIRRPHGMVLVTGPTGSGKTTTLYASLAEIRHSATKIITVEDPVEYYLDGINQIQVHSKIGLTFATGLRSILRHDPDVILIGEIRDSETAVNAIQAALTGHLVFSTLHTNDAASAFTRLTDMGIEPYLVASTVHAVMAQRLVRKLCLSCRQPVTVQDAGLPIELKVHPTAKLYMATGCRDCHGTGYRGRLAIFELLLSSTQIRKLCAQRADALDIRRVAMEQGMMSLRTSGWQHVLAGHTSVDEVLRVTADEEEASDRIGSHKELS